MALGTKRRHLEKILEHHFDTFLSQVGFKLDLLCVRHIATMRRRGSVFSGV